MNGVSDTNGAAPRIGTVPPSYEVLRATLSSLAERFPAFSFLDIGESAAGRRIGAIVIGDPTAPRRVLYVGAHHGMEWMTTLVLLRFAEEYGTCLETNRRMFGISPMTLFRTRCICLVPALNVDGITLQICGAASLNEEMAAAALRANSGSTDFSRWQANARGVDLNHNYTAGFEEYRALLRGTPYDAPAPTRYPGEAPESEPEVGALCSLLRFGGRWDLLLSLHTQGEEVYYSSGGRSVPGAYVLGKKIAALCGYRLCEPEGYAAYSGLLDECVRAFPFPAFTIECGRGENPLPLSSFCEIYAAMREMLFSAPLLV